MLPLALFLDTLPLVEAGLGTHTYLTARTLEQQQARLIVPPQCQ